MVRAGTPPLVILLHTIIRYPERQQVIVTEVLPPWSPIPLHLAGLCVVGPATEVVFGRGSFVETQLVPGLPDQGVSPRVLVRRVGVEECAAGATIHFTLVVTPVSPGRMTTAPKELDDPCGVAPRCP